MPKIIFINRYFYPDHSATSQMLSDLAFFLAASGREVCIVTSCQRYEFPDALLAPREKVRGVEVCRVRPTRFGRANLLGRALDYFTFYVAAAWTAWRLVGRGDVLVAKTDPPLISLVAMMVAKARGAHLINWLQDLFPEVAGALGMRVGRGRMGALLATLRDYSLRAARANVVLGASMAEFVERRGIPRKRITVIHNWADDRVIMPVAASANPLRVEWELAGKFVLAYSGNLGRAHEFVTILDAAGLLQHDPLVVFLIIGSGAKLGQVKHEVAQRGLRNVTFRPYQARGQLGFSLGVADMHLVTLQPALEGFIVPSKFYGIASAGRPVAFVGDQNGEIARALRLHDCGGSFAVGDCAGLAAYVRALSQDSAETARLGINARTALESNYSQAKAFDAWEKVLGACTS